MATKNVTYSCDICGKRFNSLFDAKSCELSHYKVLKISSVKYSLEDKKNQYPTSIIVEMENKKKVEYKRC